MTHQDQVDSPAAQSDGLRRGSVGRSGITVDEGERIGRVVSVTGSRAVARLEKSGHRESADALQISSLVKMRTADTIAFGMVSGMSIPAGADLDEDTESRIVDLELVGEAVAARAGEPMKFRRGISCSPTLGDAVYPASRDDLRQVYARPDVPSIQVGNIYQDQSLPAYVAIDDLLGKHFAVVGTTGTGKSCAVAAILRSLVSQHTEAHILVLDLHSEYRHAFSDCAEIVEAGRLKLPYWLLSLEELNEIVVERSDGREVDRTILDEAVNEAKRSFNEGEGGPGHYGVNSPVPYRMSEVLRNIDMALGKLDKPTDSAPYLRLHNRINALQSDQRFSFMFEEGFTLGDDMEAILSRLLRIPAQGKPITILDLSEVPSDVIQVVVSLLCRLIFDFAYWADRQTPILLVCEEANRYAAQINDVGFELTKRALSRIVNEGRKYGVSLCLVSQRPSEMETGILSQCNTIFAMRMSNQRDQDVVRGTLAESALGLMESLPSLRSGEAIAVGEGLSVPVRLYFDFLPEEQRPMSATARFSEAWKDGSGMEGYVGTIIERWRRQRR